LLWIIVAMVAARSAAMAFNRVADADIDAINPRTATRALPAGHLSRRFVVLFVVVASVVLVVAASRLNRLSLYLSPVALAIVLLYSYTKRFTRWSHIVLGFALGIAPAAAWIAIRGTLDPRILVLTAAVTFWVGGFDILYSCQDYEFDCREGLHSVPRFFGIASALWIARVLHLAMMALLVWLALLFHLGVIAAMGIAIVGALLAYEHSLVSAKDLSKLNAAFFTLNGVVSVVFFLCVAADVLLRR
jgi:4-hydroxybenzoate polyprenyltransferase